MPHMRVGRAGNPVSAWMALTLIGVALSGCGATGPAYGPPTPGVAAAIEMTPEFTFKPANVVVNAGDTVEWRNKSLISHTITADPAKAHDRSDASVPAGAAPFDSGRIPAGGVYRHTFVTPGVYRYFCTPHEDEAMLGQVTVRPQ